MQKQDLVQISPKLLQPRLAELGKIKIGGKGAERQKQDNSGTYQLPVKYDHFVVTTRNRGKDGNFIPDAGVHERVGKAPLELDVWLMFPEPEQNFQYFLSAYDS